MRPRPVDIFQDLGGGSFGISHGGLGFDRRRLGLFFFAKRTLALKETPDSTKALNKNENYNALLEIHFVFNLQSYLDANEKSPSGSRRPHPSWR